MLNCFLISGLISLFNLNLFDFGSSLKLIIQQTPTSFKEVLNLYLKSNIIVIVNNKSLTKCKIFKVGNDYVTVKLSSGNYVYYPFCSIQSIDGLPTVEVVQIIIK
ncbi:hypothetical protein DC20_00370 [Rufibacter tibetensis]|uniref:Uncharacterized protein n=1 Tax=Rufibacter tibetensis TaxID=512763 RepID=A0A0P0CFH2_9BACT|nr:hypothetical protein DC20_00370 [Rufibacter tibetensis]